MKKILPILIIFLLLMFIRNNIVSIVTTLKSTNTAASLKKQLTDEERENKFLKEKLSYVKTDKFIEEEAQEKLGMLKPGEFFVIAPTATPFNKESIVIDNKPNWQKWFEVFF